MEKKNKKAPFIIFEGCDGTGKSYLMNEVYKELQKDSFFRDRITATFQPGATFLGKKIRSLLNDVRQEKTESISSLSEFFLYHTDRIEQIEKIIKPSLERGNLILCDRWIYSSMIYQLLNKNDSINSCLSFFKNIYSETKSFFNLSSPDLVFVILSDSEICFNRIKQKNSRDLFDDADFNAINHIASAYKSIDNLVKTIGDNNSQIIYIDNNNEQDIKKNIQQITQVIRKLYQE